MIEKLARAAAWQGRPMPQVVGGRYGLSSKEFTPAMVKAALDHVAGDRPVHGFTSASSTT